MVRVIPPGMGGAAFGYGHWVAEESRRSNGCNSEDTIPNCRCLRRSVPVAPCPFHYVYKPDETSTGRKARPTQPPLRIDSIILFAGSNGGSVPLQPLQDRSSSARRPTCGTISPSRSVIAAQCAATASGVRSSSASATPRVRVTIGGLDDAGAGAEDGVGRRLLGDQEQRGRRDQLGPEAAEQFGREQAPRSSASPRSARSC